jgi:hypothetical protein
MQYINIFQSFHQDYPRNKDCHWITPIAVGGYAGENMHSDSLGENISSLNSSYCELTTQFYAWKNSKSNFVGFYHYRRYLNYLIDDSIYDSVIPGAKWYEPTAQTIQYLTSREQYERLEMILNMHDVVLPNKYILAPNIREQYFINTKEHNPWVIFMNQISQKHKGAESYFHLTARAPICNMFIMKRNIFEAYCSDLFPVINNVYKKLGQNFDKQNNRYPGFLAERYLGFWLTINKIAYHEVPMIAFK